MICKFCQQEILKKDKKVELITSEKSKEIEHLYFHFNCWVEDYRSSVDQRVEYYAKKLAMTTLPKVKELHEKGLLLR